MQLISRKFINNEYRHYSYLEVLEFTDHISKNRLNTYKKFIDKNPDLYKFEKKMMNGYDVIKDSSSAQWYIYKLAEKGRIRLPLEVLLNLKINRYYTKIDISHLINNYDLKRFIDVAESLKFPKRMIEASIIPSLERFLIYYQINFNEYRSYIEEYYKKIIDLRDASEITYYYYNYFQKVIKIFNQLDTKARLIDILLKNKNSNNRTKLYTNNPEFNEGITIYNEHLKITVADKTRKTYISHIKTFLSYLDSCHTGINKFSQINICHIHNFMEYQQNTKNMFGKYNSVETINNRAEATIGLLSFFRDKNLYDVNDIPFIKYDKLKEPKRWTRYYKQEDIFKVFKAVSNFEGLDHEKQYIMIILLIISTGRRVSEILNLEYDCLDKAEFFLGHTKNNNGGWKNIIEIAIYAIKNSQTIANNYRASIYSDFDKRTVRRLFPSLGYKGTSIISDQKVNEFFKLLQISNNIVDKNNRPLFTLYSNKKNFVTSMMNLGVSPLTISQYLNQNINSLIPYEVNNQLAVEALKKAEEKGLLIGKEHEEFKSRKYDKITSLLDDINVVERHKANLMFKINNPKADVMPLVLGFCNDYNNFDICSDLICLPCDNFVPGDIEEFNGYAITKYKYIYSFKRNSKVKKIEKMLIDGLQISFNKIEKDNCKLDFLEAIKEVKKRAREAFRNKE